MNVAGQRGWAARKISNCLYLEAFDFRRLQNIEEVKSELDKQKAAEIGDWEFRKDFVFTMCSLDALTFTPNCAPFSVFPFSSRTCIELAIGSKCYYAHMNVNAVTREFQNYGWEVEKSSEELATSGELETLLMVRKGGFHASVPPGDFMRMQLEALRPKTVIKGLESVFKAGPVPGEEYVLWLYSGESALWR